MTSLPNQNPLSRFTGLADIYAQYRPTYPAVAIDYVIACCNLTSASILADIGCGTGISSRLFAGSGLQVIGIEPNTGMRQKAEAEPTNVIRYQDGTAEATGLADQSVDVVLAAQAFHWFKADDAFREFQRILKPGGWVVLLWNERDESDPFTAAYGDVVRTCPETAAVEGPRAKAGEPLLSCPLFEDAERLLFPNEQLVDEEGLLGRAFSASYAPKAPTAAAAFAAALRAVFAKFQREGRVVIRYITSVYLARSNPSHARQ